MVVEHCRFLTSEVSSESDGPDQKRPHNGRREVQVNLAAG